MNTSFGIGPFRFEDLVIPVIEANRWYFLHLTSDPFKADDLKQNIHLILLLKYRANRLDDVRNLDAWIKVKSRSLNISEYHKEERFIYNLVEETNAAPVSDVGKGEKEIMDRLQQREISEVFNMALDLLLPFDADLVVWWKFHELSMKEISDRLGIKEDEARRKARSAWSKFKRRVKKVIEKQKKRVEKQRSARALTLK